MCVWWLVVILSLVGIAISTDCPRVRINGSSSIELPEVHPVIYVIEDPHRHQELRAAVQKERLLIDHGDKPIRLTSSNAHSHGKRVVTLPNDDASKKTHIHANETWYLFGNNEDSSPFKELSLLYDIPNCGTPCQRQERGNAGSTVVSGIGGAGSGVSFHFHGSGFSEVLTGRKRWFLYAPEYEPMGGGFASMVNQTVKDWIRSSDFATVQRREFYDCTIEPGEALFFPSQWMHATLNLDAYTYFVSVFLPT
eukprot:GSChrysophyteH1.ASY1.ANO1.509.1 assembled CDS